ncbi:unnamed protein product [Adineta ricciae]|uniref:Uncharacterized protein n=1 Tax=Adineta ricciae TaxID=249248 RepID=A0A815C1Z0_ADIRI|nr:unnamed protein product [Adineta ricciae]CAF1613137.1 unnamed protein product [Adineta ricciae]
MYSAKNRKAVKPIEQKNPNTIIQNHVMKNTNAANVLVAEYDVIHKERPISCWKRDLIIPRWLLLTLVTLGILAIAAFLIFTLVVTLQKSGNGGPCKTNSDCRQDRGLMCNNYRCGCAYSHFWSETYLTCERRRMINRTCVNDSECDILANLQCFNVTLSNGDIQLQCQCKASLNWDGVICKDQGLYNDSCLTDANCDTTRYLYCDLSLGKICQCNTSMFWNGKKGSGTCEYKRTVNQYCYPYDDSWCDYSAPMGQGLTCAKYSNPYGSEYGVCQCGSTQFYNGTPSLGNGFCEPLRTFNKSCTATSNCDYRKNLICTKNLCSCPLSTNYDPSVIISSGVTGYCKPAATYWDNCTSIILCSTSQGLYCDYTIWGSLIVGQCLCNSSFTFWDGSTCANKLSIGGKCTTTVECSSGDGLFCSNYSQSIGTCDCDKNHFWNYTCIQKQLFNTSCTSSYVCDDNRGLFCQGTGGALFQKCDCFNISYVWDSLYVTNHSKICVLKMGFGQSTCFGDMECQDYRYLKCFNGTCLCNYDMYWDGNVCQDKRNHSVGCTNTYECRDFSPVNLICTTTSTGLQACLCNISSYWEPCTATCLIAKHRHEPCTLVSNCSTQECSKLENLQCINDSNSNQTKSGWCNCTSIQWWNGTYCRDKGIPSWGANSSAVCNATYQCADYNLVSCPFGSSSITSVATCECATTKYWNGITCIDRVLFGQSCTDWTFNPVNTSTCLSAAGAGLICQHSSGFGNGTFVGTCVCPTKAHWNATFSICVY